MRERERNHVRKIGWERGVEGARETKSTRVNERVRERERYVKEKERDI